MFDLDSSVHADMQVRHMNGIILPRSFSEYRMYATQDIGIELKKLTAPSSLRSLDARLITSAFLEGHPFSTTYKSEYDQREDGVTISSTGDFQGFKWNRKYAQFGHLLSIEGEKGDITHILRTIWNAQYGKRLMALAALGFVTLSSYYLVNGRYVVPSITVESDYQPAVLNHDFAYAALVALHRLHDQERRGVIDRGYGQVDQLNTLIPGGMNSRRYSLAVKLYDLADERRDRNDQPYPRYEWSYKGIQPNEFVQAMEARKMLYYWMQACGADVAVPEA